MKLISIATGEEIKDIIDCKVMMDCFEYRLASQGNMWEEITPQLVRIIAQDKDRMIQYASVHAKQLARNHQCEVRWNFFWSSQGHYIQPD